MIEPLSVIGFLGTSCGILNTILSTPGVLSKRVDDYKACGRRLRASHNSLAVCRISLEAWKKVWCQRDGQPYSAGTYGLLWGRDHFFIFDQLNLIREEHDEIGLFLFGTHFSASNPGTTHGQYDWASWHRTLQSFAKSKDSSTLEYVFEPGRIYGVAFSLWKGATLEERIGRLKVLVEELRFLSNAAFWKAQYRLNLTRVVEDKDVLLLLTRKRWFDDLNDKVQCLHSLCSRSQTIWSLVLRHPGEGGPAAMDDDDEVMLQFEVVSKTQPRMAIGVVQVKSAELNDRSALNDYVNNIRNQPISMVPDGWSSTLREIVLRNSQGIQDPSLFNGTIHGQANRLVTALGMANWVVLLWNSPWTFNLCTCGLRYSFIRDVEAWYPTLTTGDTVTHHPFPQTVACCHDSVPNSHKALLLAIALTELAILRPLAVQLAPSTEIRFSLATNQQMSRCELQQYIQ